MTKLTKNRRRPFKCGHRGMGVECHRCSEAQRMEDYATGAKKPGNAKYGDKAWLTAEAARLRAA